MISSKIKPLFNALTSILHQKQGKYTSELLRSPGEFGLGQVPLKWKPTGATNMICGFCATGCSLKVHLKDKQAVNLSPNIDYPVNLGMACPKGWEALSPLKSDERAGFPMIKDGKGGYKEISWHQALERFTDKMKDTQKRHGKESVAFLSTGQIPTEEMALLGALTKFGMGLLHGDGNTRQCMATAVVAYKQSFGFDAPPYTYKDFEESDVIVLVGSNMCIAHPIMWERICKNPHNPEIIVIDPRKTETAMSATQHYMIDPKSDLVFFYGLARILINNGNINEEYIAEHCNDFETFKEHVQDYTEEMVFEKSGIPKESLHTLADTIAAGKRVSFWWTMGVNQSHEGVRVAQSLINIALMTGNIGRPGTGANSITGQCNAMGSRLFSNTTNLLGGHSFESADDRKKIADITGIAVENIPDKNGYAYDQIVDAIDKGEIKALWVIATNSAHSWIHHNKFKDTLKKLDFLVVQDMYQNTATAKEADLILPAAGWGEKDGTFINSERRIGPIKKIAKAPGQAMADFFIFKLIAHYWGVGEMFKEWETPEKVFQILKKLSRGQPCDFSGITDYKMIDEQGGIQWPYAEGENDTSNERRLFSDGNFYHKDNKAKFIFESPKKLPEPCSVEYPYTLLTGRGTSAQWHTQTRTKQSDVLHKLYPENIYVEINPENARSLHIKPYEKIRVFSKRGTVEAQALLTPTVKPHQIFIPMHYKDINKLTFPSFDSYSRQPSYKYCAVNVEKIEQI